MKPSIWTGMRGELPLHEAMRALHNCGWNTFELSTEHLVAIETSQDCDGLIRQSQRCLQELPISAPQAHGYLQANVAHPDEARRESDIKRLLEHIEIASQLGAKVIVIHPGGKTDADASELDAIREINVASFRRLADVASEHGMQIGIENMIFLGNTTAADIVQLVKEIDHPSIGITIDTSHANMSGINAAEMVCEFGARIIATHLSDNDGSGDQHRIPGDGTIDWPSVMSAFRKIKYEGILNLEIPGARHKVPGILDLKTRYALDVAKWLTNLTNEVKHAQ